mmetsp:Transcript_19990/g.26382  ORF Transcript_19990/g.26382 Transcript_19990/m.26382 type:complete len:220 (-) Transcript_19990:1838-2497(-)
MTCLCSWILGQPPKRSTPTCLTIRNCLIRLDMLAKRCLQLPSPQLCHSWQTLPPAFQQYIHLELSAFSWCCATFALFAFCGHASSRLTSTISRVEIASCAWTTTAAAYHACAKTRRRISGVIKQHPTRKKHLKSRGALRSSSAIATTHCSTNFVIPFWSFSSAWQSSTSHSQQDCNRTLTLQLFYQILTITCLSLIPKWSTLVRGKSPLGSLWSRSHLE